MNLKYYLLILQLEAYKLPRFLRWLRNNSTKLLRPSFEQGQPVWTGKARRLQYLSYGVIVVVALLLFYFCDENTATVLTLLLIWQSYLPLLIALLLIQPVEKFNRVLVKRSISQTVQALPTVTVVGITGSFGKTSTKLILAQLLSRTLVTPRSYNTLFGIYGVIRYELHKRYRSFVCEMGAYRRGDIREFCQLVRPQIGVLVGINETHLERFKSIENTITAKFEILQNLRKDGVGIVNLDNDYIFNNLDRATCRLVGVTVEGRTTPKCEKILSAKNIRIEDGIAHFDLLIPDSGVVEQFATPLLGQGHLRNALLAIAVALELGEEITDLKERFKSFSQLPRRLEYRLASGINILDNSFSSNPDSFKESLNVLASFGSQKILVTPGIVELGAASVPIHEQLGRLAGSIADEIVLVGSSEKVEALKRGALSAGFVESSISIVSDARDLQNQMRKAKPGATILFENVSELPAHYL